MPFIIHDDSPFEKTFQVNIHFIMQKIAAPRQMAGAGRLRGVIPTRCRDLHLKRFCLEDVVPATQIILIAHIILAIRWMLIKILSVVINHHGEYKVIVVVGLGVL